MVCIWYFKLFLTNFLISHTYYFEIRIPSEIQMGALSAPSWCVLSMLCNITHVKQMSLTTFGLCSVVPIKYPESAHQYSKCIFHCTPASGDPVVFYSLFPCELCSALGFHYPWHQSKGVVTQQEIVQIWLSLLQ